MYENKDLHKAAENARVTITHLADVLEHFEDTLVDKKVLLNRMREIEEDLEFILAISAEDDDD